LVRRLFPSFLCLFAVGGAVVRPAAAPEHALMRAMAQMTTAMAKVPMTGAIDRDFAQMMIPHHAGAIAMAEAELQYGHDPVLLRLAQEIVVTQQQEIVVMRRALAAAPHPRPSRAPAALMSRDTAHKSR